MKKSKKKKPSPTVPLERAKKIMSKILLRKVKIAAELNFSRDSPLAEAFLDLFSE